jgi:hypothetical protein
MSKKSLLQQHREFIQRVKDNGGKTLTYKTPCCDKELEDRAAPKGNEWDTMSVCPYCGTHYMKFISHKAIVGKVAHL